MAERKIEDLKSYSPKALKELVNTFVNTNKSLAAKGLDPISLNIHGHAGLGKTAIVEQVAQSQGMAFENIPVAQLTETGDVLGFPTVEHQMTGDGSPEPIWVNENVISDYRDKGYSPTGKTRMGIAPPEWLSDKPMILLLDDYTRAVPHMLQACMEIIEKQRTPNWKLPKGSTVIMTTNPSDDADYVGVNAMGSAQTTRFAQVHLVYDKTDWAEYATRRGIDGRCINFMLMNPELVKEKVSPPRLFEKFFNLVSCVPNWNSTEGLTTINDLGTSTVGGTITSHFVTFIHNKLDRIPEPEEIFSENSADTTVTKLVMDSCIVEDSIREDIVSTMMFRVKDYLKAECLEKRKSITKHMVKRLELLCTLSHNKIDLVGVDNMGNIGRELMKDDRDASLMQEMWNHPAIKDKITLF